MENRGFPPIAPQKLHNVPDPDRFSIFLLAWQNSQEFHQRGCGG